MATQEDVRAVLSEDFDFYAQVFKDALADKTLSHFSYHPGMPTYLTVVIEGVQYALDMKRSRFSDGRTNLSAQIVAERLQTAWSQWRSVTVDFDPETWVFRFDTHEILGWVDVQVRGIEVAAHTPQDVPWLNWGND